MKNLSEIRKMKNKVVRVTKNFDGKVSDTIGIFKGIKNGFVVLFVGDFNALIPLERVEKIEYPTSQEEKEFIKSIINEM